MDMSLSSQAKLYNQCHFWTGAQCVARDLCILPFPTVVVLERVCVEKAEPQTEGAQVTGLTHGEMMCCSHLDSWVIWSKK